MITLEPAALPEGEPRTDRAWKVKETGRIYRVRIVEKDKLPARVEANGTPKLRSRGFGVAVSVSLLDNKGRVKKNAADELMVFDGHTRTVEPHDLAAPNFDMTDLVMKLVRDRIAEAEAQIVAAENVATFWAKLDAGEPVG